MLDLSANSTDPQFLDWLSSALNPLPVDSSLFVAFIAARIAPQSAESAAASTKKRKTATVAVVGAPESDRQLGARLSEVEPLLEILSTKPLESIKGAFVLTPTLFDLLGMCVRCYFYVLLYKSNFLLFQYSIWYVFMDVL